MPYSEQRYLEALRTHGAATSTATAVIDEITPVLSGVQWEIPLGPLALGLFQIRAADLS